MAALFTCRKGAIQKIPVTWKSFIENRVLNGGKGNNSSFSLYIYSFLVLDQMRFLFVLFFFKEGRVCFYSLLFYSYISLDSLFPLSPDSSCRQFLDTSIEFHSRTKMLTVAIKTGHLHNSDARAKLYFNSILRKHKLKNQIYTRRITGEEIVDL